MDGARVVCVMLVLFVSNEVLGATLAYEEAGRVAADVVSRLQRVKAAGYPQDDLLLIFGDYNSAVESAPMFLDGLYEARQDKLNKLWSEHSRAA